MPCNVFRCRNVLIAHITASVFINDDERGLHADYEDWLEQLAPHEPISRYCHNRTGEDACPLVRERLATPIWNGRHCSGLQYTVMGREVVVAITDGRLDDSTELVEAFGPWEQISYGEFDGRRRKRVLVKIIGE
jgi:thiamine phosphate synthase YjbQ (UPF0047 family)